MSVYSEISIIVVLKDSTYHTSLVVGKNDTVDRVLYHVHRLYDIPLANLRVVDCEDNDDILENLSYINCHNIVDSNSIISSNNILVVDIAYGGYDICDVTIAHDIDGTMKSIIFKNTISTSKIMDMINRTVESLKLPSGDYVGYRNDSEINNDMTVGDLFDGKNNDNIVITIKKLSQQLRVIHVDGNGNKIKNYYIRNVYSHSISDIRRIIQVSCSNCSAIGYYYALGGDDRALDRFIVDLEHKTINDPLIVMEIKLNDLNKMF